MLQFRYFQRVRPLGATHVRSVGLTVAPAASAAKAVVEDVTPPARS
jgi:hypothetical protein